MKDQCIECSSERIKINEQDYRCLNCGGLYVRTKLWEEKQWNRMIHGQVSAVNI